LEGRDNNHYTTSAHKWN